MIGIVLVPTVLQMLSNKGIQQSCMNNSESKTASVLSDSTQRPNASSHEADTPKIHAMTPKHEAVSQKFSHEGAKDFPMSNFSMDSSIKHQKSK